MRRTLALRFVVGIDAGGPKHGWTRLRNEANELRAFLACSPNVVELGQTNAPQRVQADVDGEEGVLRSFYFARFLGPREYDWGALTVSPRGRERLKDALAAREAVLAALDVTDYEVEKQTALAGAGLRYVRYGSVPPWLAEPRQPLVQNAARNPGHPHFDPDAREVWQAGVGTSFFSKLVQWSFDPVFKEPDFTDGLAAAFHAVTSRVTAAVAGGAQHYMDLEDMIHPKLLASLQDAVGQVSDTAPRSPFPSSLFSRMPAQGFETAPLALVIDLDEWRDFRRRCLPPRN